RSCHGPNLMLSSPVRRLSFVVAGVMPNSRAGMRYAFENANAKSRDTSLCSLIGSSMVSRAGRSRDAAGDRDLLGSYRPVPPGGTSRQAHGVGRWSGTSAAGCRDPYGGSDVAGDRAVRPAHTE